MSRSSAGAISSHFPVACAAISQTASAPGPAEYPERRSWRIGLSGDADREPERESGVRRERGCGRAASGTGEHRTDAALAGNGFGWAQELFGRRGELSAIQLKLPDPSQRDGTIARLRDILPKDVRVAAPARRTEEVDKMLGGFQLNLTMMSLVSMFVGMFLIYNTVSASVVRRQHEIGILRSLGVTRNEIRSLFLAEAAVLGAIGSVFGLLGGVVLARMLVRAVSTTISSLYVLVSVRDLTLHPWAFAVAGLIGVGSVIVSAFFPAQAAAKQKPIEALHGGIRLERSVNPSIAWLISGRLG